MFFSILIANYNNGHFFKDCFKSIVEQTYSNWEAVIVDDGSTDDSVEIIKSLIQNDQRFRLYENKENMGCGFTKNRCTQLASGDILGFVDPDDALVPEAIEVMVKGHQKNREAALITSNYELVDLQLNSLRKGMHAGEVPMDESYLTYGKGSLTHFATFKKKFYKDTEGIDPSMTRAVDQDLYYKLEEQGELVFLDKILYRYRIHDKSISHNENLFKAKYWHFYAMRRAFLRRRKISTGARNLSRKQVNKMSSDYYLARLERVKFTSKTKTKWYFLWKSLIASPFHKTVRKAKIAMLILSGKI